MTEPSIIDYYNDYPQIISVIDKLNEETHSLKKENEKLRFEILDMFKKFNKELKEYKAITELKLILLEIANNKRKKKKKFNCF